MTETRPDPTMECANCHRRNVKLTVGRDLQLTNVRCLDCGYYNWVATPLSTIDALRQAQLDAARSTRLGWINIPTSGGNHDDPV